MEHTDEPFLTYTSSRPHRIAFLLDIKHPESFNYLEKIIDYAHAKWGGRFFQIIPVVNGRVEQPWLDYLREYDPDIIGALCDLNKHTLRKITLASSPYLFERLDMERGGIGFYSDPIDVLPSEENTANIWRNPFDSPPKIFEMAMHPVSTSIPDEISQFIRFNFGQLNTLRAGTKQLESYHVNRIDVRDKQTFLEAMKLIEGWSRYIYPSDYSRLPGVYYEHRKEARESAMLFIGDDPIDVIHYWNQSLMTPDWLSKKMIYAWLPTALLDDTEILASIKKWLPAFVSIDNGNGSHELLIASKSLSRAKLQKYQKALSEGTYINVNTLKINQPTAPKYSPRIGVTSEMTSYSVVGEAFNINLRSIDQQQGFMEDQSWMIDFYIQQKDDDNNVQPPKDFWLQFPKNNNLSSLVFPKRVSRVNRLGLPSLPMTRKPEDLLLKVIIPTERQIVSNILLLSSDRTSYSIDLRKGILEAPFDHYLNSEAGRQLRGFLHLFDSMMEPFHFFENPYWRRTIMALSGEDTSLDSPRNKALRGRISKNLNKVNKPITERAIDSWTTTIQSYAHQLKIQAIYKDFEYFKNELEAEFELPNKVDDATKYSRSAEERMRQGLSWLISKNILQSGFMNKCYHCSLITWYGIDEAKTLNECSGCGYQFFMDAEQKWQYKLNSISSTNGAVYNQIPIIAALGELRSRSTQSFFYASPVEVYEKGSESPLTDIDLFVITDGRLVIGEVKNDQNQLKEDDFDKLYKVGIKLRPSIIYISCPEEKPTRLTQQRIDELQTKLKPYNIGVSWLTFERSFEFFLADPEYTF